MVISVFFILQTLIQNFITMKKMTILVCMGLGFFMTSYTKINSTPYQMEVNSYQSVKSEKTISHLEYVDELDLGMVPGKGIISCWINVNGVPTLGAMCTVSSASNCSAYTSCMTRN